MKVKCPFSPKHPAKTAGAEPHRFSSCGRVSMGTPGKEIKVTVSEMRLGWTSFLMSSVHCLKILCYTLAAHLLFFKYKWPHCRLGLVHFVQLTMHYLA